MLGREEYESTRDTGGADFKWMKRRRLAVKIEARYRRCVDDFHDIAVRYLKKDINWKRRPAPSTGKGPLAPMVNRRYGSRLGTDENDEHKEAQSRLFKRLDNQQDQVRMIFKYINFLENP